MIPFVCHEVGKDRKRAAKPAGLDVLQLEKTLKMASHFPMLL
ncbi:hypothetical protein [Gaoshiqia sediminis]|uniref:Uncharacterized protein n=1 Tax=Gaoshiqia sediminis TaxID=2986998 RepID=A0AA41Y1X1_9BACT|nr:hypothetical protein [Gaoshiqia sediminis]MCW0481956.1 hypothetical protein [Gaoshiqia sediminis]